jgi:hypothetical protein
MTGPGAPRPGLLVQLGVALGGGPRGQGHAQRHGSTGTAARAPRRPGRRRPAARPGPRAARRRRPATGQRPGRPAHVDPVDDPGGGPVRASSSADRRSPWTDGGPGGGPAGRRGPAGPRRRRPPGRTPAAEGGQLVSCSRRRGSGRPGGPGPSGRWASLRTAGRWPGSRAAPAGTLRRRPRPRRGSRRQAGRASSVPIILAPRTASRTPRRRADQLGDRDRQRQPGASAGSTVISAAAGQHHLAAREAEQPVVAGPEHSHVPAGGQQRPGATELRELAADQPGGEVRADFLLGGSPSAGRPAVRLRRWSGPS